MHKLRCRLAGLASRVRPAGVQAPGARRCASSGAELELYVRNLPKTATADQVRRAFLSVCKVINVTVPADRATGEGRGFAFVTVAAAELEAAWKMDQTMLDGRPMDVALSAESRTSPKATSRTPLHLRQPTLQDGSARPLQRKPSGGPAARPTGRSLAIVLNQQIIASEVASDILQLFDSDGFDFNAVNLATCFHKLGALSHSVEPSATPQLQKLAQRAAASMTDDAAQWSAQGIANTCWGLAKLEIDAPELFAAVVAEAPRKIATFNPQALANTAWAFSRCNVSAPQLFRAISEEAPKQITAFNPQALSNILWAFANANQKAPTLFGVVADQAVVKIATFTAQNLSNTAWAFAKAGHKAPALFEALAEECPIKLGTFKPQELANLVWAFSTADVAAPLLFDDVAKAAIKVVSWLRPQELANIVWAFSKTSQPAPMLFDAVALVASTKIGQLNAQDLANMVMAYAQTKHSAPDFFAAVALEAPKKMGTFNKTDVSNMVWAYQETGFEAPMLFRAIAKRTDDIGGSPAVMQFLAQQGEL
mmetsp:Transcript_23131/g.80247  ORF Transcript_23131/g.80247 Transcript_23131/m.80247 type:complete len:538 (+) Transcript_23131:58-1671(+)